MVFFMVFILQVISGHTGWVRCVAVDVSNEWFATGSADRTIKVSKAQYVFAILHKERNHQFDVFPFCRYGI